MTSTSEQAFEHGSRLGAIFDEEDSQGTADGVEGGAWVSRRRGDGFGVGGGKVERERGSLPGTPTARGELAAVRRGDGPGDGEAEAQAFGTERVGS